MKYLLLLVLSICTFYIAKAQQPKPAAKQERLENLSETFSVDKLKAAEIAAALDFNRDKIRAAAGNEALTPKARQEQISVLEAERQARIRLILTPQQFATLQARITARDLERKAETERQRQELRIKVKAWTEEQMQKKESKKP